MNRNVSLSAFRAGSVYIMDLGITRNSGLDYLPRYRNKNGAERIENCFSQCLVSLY